MNRSASAQPSGVFGSFIGGKVVTDGVAGLSGCGWCGVYSGVARWGVNVLKGVECGTCVSDDWGVLGVVYGHWVYVHGMHDCFVQKSLGTV